DFSATYKHFALKFRDAVFHISVSSREAHYTRIPSCCKPLKANFLFFCSSDDLIDKMNIFPANPRQYWPCRARQTHSLPCKKRITA
ncbi:hypothetical protein, partial [Kosakonia sp. BK9b]